MSAVRSQWSSSLRGALLLGCLSFFLMSLPVLGEAKTLAKVGRFEITEEIFNNYLAQRPENQRQLSVEERQDLLDQLITEFALHEAALREKLDEDPNLKVQAEILTRSLYAHTMHDRLMEKAITEADIQAYYEKETKRYAGQDEYSAAQIVVKTEAEAKEIIKRLSKEDFYKLANEKSVVNRDRLNGGKTGWFFLGQLAPALQTVLPKLKKGEFTKTPINTAAGWTIMKLEERRAWQTPPLDMIRPNIIQALREQKIQGVMSQLKQEVGVEIFQ